MIEILAETPALHAEAIEALYDRTFGPGHFAKTAERLREHNASLPELNRVALTGQAELIGVVRLWPIMVDQGGAALFVGPVAVHPDYRGARLGLKLCALALEAATEQGWLAAFIIGSPSYFSSIEFEPVAGDRFKLPGPQDMSRFMQLNLAKDAPEYSGQINALRCHTSGGQFA